MRGNYDESKRGCFNESDFNRRDSFESEEKQKIESLPVEKRLKLGKNELLKQP